MAEEIPQGRVFFGSTAAELMCKTGKSGTETVVVSGKACSVNADGSSACVNAVDILNGLSAYSGLTGANLQNSNVPCSLAQAAINNAFLNRLCIESANIYLGIIGEQLGLGISIGLDMDPAASLPLANGNILVQWNGFCVSGGGLLLR
jgi:hypothetical protein